MGHPTFVIGPNKNEGSLLFAQIGATRLVVFDDLGLAHGHGWCSADIPVRELLAPSLLFGLTRVCDR